MCQAFQLKGKIIRLDKRAPTLSCLKNTYSNIKSQTACKIKEQKKIYHMYIIQKTIAISMLITPKQVKMCLSRDKMDNFQFIRKQ